MMKKILYTFLLICVFGAFFTIKVDAKLFTDTGTVYVTKGNKTVLRSRWTLGRKRMYHLDDKVVYLKSSNRKVATVNKNGVVTAKRPGKTNIRIKVYMGGKKRYTKKHTWKIVVKNRIGVKKKYDYKKVKTNGKVCIELVKYKGYDSLIKIPKKIDNLPVRRIGEYCFGKEAYEELTCGMHIPIKITMGNNIAFIGKGAFSGCTSLKEITISNKLQYIEQSVFAYSNIKKMNVSPIYRLGYIPDFTFSGVPMFDNAYVKIPGKVKTIGRSSFYDTQIKTLVLEEGIETVGETAFHGLTKTPIFDTLIIPSSMKTIGAGAFYSDKLTKVFFTSNDTVIDEGAFKTRIIEDNHAIKIPLCIYGAKDSTAYKWARLNKVEFIEWSKPLCYS